MGEPRHRFPRFRMLPIPIALTVGLLNTPAEHLETRDKSPQGLVIDKTIRNCLARSAAKTAPDAHFL